MKFDSNLPVLIAEDSEDDALLLRRGLQKCGISSPIHICGSGEEVVMYLKAEGIYADRSKYKFPRVLFLDLKMPRMNGLELLKWLQVHSDCSVIPTIVLTSSTQESDIKEAYKLGANAYWVKPNSFEKLAKLIDLNFRYWASSELPQVPSGRC